MNLEPFITTGHRDKKVLVVTVGLPRSGKSTWAKSQACPTVCPDSIRLALYGQTYIKEAEKIVWAIADLMVKSLFISGHSTVILDATNLTRKQRAQWESDQWETYFKVFNAPAEECLKRTDDLTLKEVITRMAESFEPLEEGDKLWVF